MSGNDADRMLEENSRRTARRIYDPITGNGARGRRVHIHLPDAPLPDIWLPGEMVRKSVIARRLKDSMTFSEYIASAGLDASRSFDVWKAICEERYAYDFEFYAAVIVTITDKETGRLVPFILNDGQRELLESMESQREAGAPIRIIHLKARQYGGSTLIHHYMDWIQIIHRTRWNSVICAHTKDAAINIRSMFDTSFRHMLPIAGRTMTLAPFEQTNNIKIIKERGCRITVGTAAEPDSVRSQDVKMAHFSEVAYYPDTEKMRTSALVSSIVSSIPRVPYSFVAYESTANGIGDFFELEWSKATRGESAFNAVFVAWFKISIYSERFNGTYNNHSGHKVEGGAMEFVETMTDYERNLFETCPSFL